MDSVTVYFRRQDTDEVVHSFQVRLPISERTRERMLLGALTNMADGLYIDDSEIDKAQEAPNAG